MTGKIHPIAQIIREISKVFIEMGFEIASGPEMDTTWYNFDALNVPENHPARDMQDTFWIKGKQNTVMRTHTSNVQIHFMESHKPPFKIIVPGKVFRNEATDATHEVQFHQVEGMVIAKDISVAHLKGTLETFLKKLLGKEIEFRLRPGFFPFVEPGFEVDLKFKGKWLEVLGAGMVHPQVLRNGDIDPQKFSGFAFGMGIDRLAMMKYDITDVRLFYNGDIRLHHHLK